LGETHNTTLKSRTQRRAHISLRSTGGSGAESYESQTVNCLSPKGTLDAERYFLILPD